MPLTILINIVGRCDLLNKLQATTHIILLYTLEYNN